EKMLFEVSEGRLQHVPGWEPVRRKLLEEALGYYQGFLEEQSDDPQIRYETARTHNSLGNVYYWLAEREKAAAAARASIAICEQLLNEFPNDPEYGYELSQCYELLGNTLEKIGQLQEAKAAHTLSLNLRKWLVDRFTLPRFREALAQSYRRLGRLAANDGRK